MSIARARSGWIPLALTLAACAGSGEGLDENGRPVDGSPAPDPLGPTLESIQQHVFSPRCATCHAGTGAPLGLRLEDAQTSYDNLVEVRSVEVPALFRVEPGNPDDSYLVHKLEGTQAVGERMPRGQTPLPQEDIDVIRQWIADGAAPPAAAARSVFLPARDLPAR